MLYVTEPPMLLANEKLLLWCIKKQNSYVAVKVLTIKKLSYNKYTKIQP